MSIILDHRDFALHGGCVAFLKTRWHGLQTHQRAVCSLRLAAFVSAWPQLSVVDCGQVRPACQIEPQTHNLSPVKS
jgi:hypothetical protein